MRQSGHRKHLAVFWSMADQTEFTTALLNPDMPVPEGIVRPDGTPATKRFDVYRNNVIASLITAMGDAFPVIKKLVGEEFFDAVALHYVKAYPPQSPLIMFYGENFAEFLAGFEPAQQVPYLPDMARLEHARRKAYHAADDSAIAPEQFAQIPQDNLANVRLTFHASTEVIASAYPIFSIWRFNATNDGDGVSQLPEDALVSRPGNDVEMRLLPPGGAAFIGALQNQRTLAEAADMAGLASADFDLSENIGGLLAARIIHKIEEQ